VLLPFMTVSSLRKVLLVRKYRTLYGCSSNYLTLLIGVTRQPIAGDFINEQILLQFGQLNLNPIPQYMVEKKTFVDPDQPANAVLRERPNTTASFHKYMLMVC
jgi:hypothetical protein